MATYYLDATNGSDTNDGLSQAWARKTWAALKALLADGDTIRFKRGETWNEIIDLSALDNVTIEAYGDGQHPVFDGQGARDCLKLDNVTNSRFRQFIVQNPIGAAVLNNILINSGPSGGNRFEQFASIGGYRGFNHATGSDVRGLVFDTFLIYWPWDDGIDIQDAATANYATIRRGYFELVGATNNDAGDTQGDAISAHGNSYVNVYDCRAVNCRRGLGIQANDLDSVFDRCFAIGADGGITTGTFKGGCAGIAHAGTSGKTILRNSIIVLDRATSGASIGHGAIAALGGNGLVHAENCTILVDTKVGLGAAFFVNDLGLAPNTPIIKATNCGIAIIGASAAQSGYFWYIPTFHASCFSGSDYNGWFDVWGRSDRFGGSDHATFMAAAGATATHDVGTGAGGTNPQFRKIDVNGGMTDPEWFRLGSTSPWRNAGAGLSASFGLDYWGAERSAWEIGAHEFGTKGRLMGAVARL